MKVIFKIICKKVGWLDPKSNAELGSEDSAFQPAIQHGEQRAQSTDIDRGQCAHGVSSAIDFRSITYRMGLH